MPHLLRLPRETESRLDHLCQQTGMSKAELIEQCLGIGLDDLETQLHMEGASKRPVTQTSLDQLLRESGLGA
jgi:predicted DNA-binding protein